MQRIGALRPAAGRSALAPSFMAAWVLACVALLGATPAARAQPPALTTLYTFADGTGTVAQQPFGTLVEGSDGYLYGTTALGGLFDVCSVGCGVVFKMSPTGTLTTLHAFENSDGSQPAAGLTPDGSGSFYGSTMDSSGNSCGTLFKIDMSGVFSGLLAFNCLNGATPTGNLLLASNGILYGTSLGASGQDDGTVFSVTTSGTLTVLHAFSGGDGAVPYAGLIAGPDGNFYGTTAGGGLDSCPGGLFTIAQGACGTVFRITPSGAMTTMHFFSGADGSYPYGALLLGADGYFYGTTASGGGSTNCPGGCGTVFRMALSGALTTLYSFSGSDGSYPHSALVERLPGQFFGTTLYGGPSDCAYNFSPVVVGGCGTLFTIDSTGALTSLHAFQGSDGAFPYAGPTLSKSGSIYGTTTGNTTLGVPTVLGTAFWMDIPTSVTNYDPLTRQLFLSPLVIGNEVFSNIVVTIGKVVAGPLGAAPIGFENSYNPANNQLTVPVAAVTGGNPYYNTTVTVKDLVSIGSVRGADRFDGAYLTIPSVQVLGGSAYSNVVITVAKVDKVGGGMPTLTRDKYIAQSNQLMIPAVQAYGNVYTNVVVTVGTLVSVGP